METPSWIVTALIKSHMLTVSINLYICKYTTYMFYATHIYERIEKMNKYDQQSNIQGLYRFYYAL